MSLKCHIYVTCTNYSIGIKGEISNIHATYKHLDIIHYDQDHCAQLTIILTIMATQPNYKKLTIMVARNI